MSEFQYVYDGILVRKTGRRAVKQQQPANSSRRRRNVSISKQYQYEIEPAEGDITWRKWVKEEELYIVEHEDMDNEENT